MSRAEQFVPFGAGALAALLHLCVVLVPPVGVVLAYFALAPLAAVGLAFGFMPAAVAAAVATLIIGVAAPGVGALTLFLLTSAAPLLMVVYFATRPVRRADGQQTWSPVDRLLSSLLILALCYFAIALLLFSGHDGGLRGAISGYLQTLFGGLQGLPPELRDAAIDAMALYFPSVALVSWLLMIIVNGAVAQKLVSHLGHNLRPTPHYSMVEAPFWPLGAVILGVALAFFSGPATFLGMNLMIISAVPFVLNGYALLHAASRRWPFRRLILCVVYVFSAAQLWPIAGFGLLGVAESRLKFRARLNARGSGQT